MYFKFYVYKLLWKLWYRSLYLSGFHLIKDHVACKDEVFWTIVLITLTWLDHVTRRRGTLSFCYIFPLSLVVEVFLKVVQQSFWMLLDHVTCRNGIVSFWYVFPSRLVIAAFVRVTLWVFFVTSSWNQRSCLSPCPYFLVPTKFGPCKVYFLKLWYGNIENRHFKVRHQL